jgi:hypothetical protein
LLFIGALVFIRTDLRIRKVWHASLPDPSPQPDKQNSLQNFSNFLHLQMLKLPSAWPAQENATHHEQGSSVT